MQRTPEQYERTEAAACVGSYEFDLVTGERHWSRGMYRLFKRNPELGPIPPVEFIAQIHPDDRAQLLEAMKATMEHGLPLDVEYRFVFPDGETRYFVAMADATKDVAGRPLLISGIARDITLKRRADVILAKREAQLCEIQRRFEQAEMIARVGSVEVDLLTGERHWSPEMFRLWKRDPALGPMDPSEMLLLVHPGDRERVAEGTKFAQQGAKPFDLEYQLVFPDGETRHIRGVGHITKDEAGRPIRLTGTTQDITQKRETLLALRRSEERYERAESMANVGSIEVDLSTGERVWSPEMFRLWRRDPALGPMPPSDWLLLVHPEDRKRVSAGIAALFRDGERFDQEFQLLFRDGETRHMRIIADVMRDEAGHAVRIIGTTQDITEKRSVLLALARSEEHFERAEEASQVGSLEFDLVSGARHWSRELYRLWRRDPELGPFQTEDWLAHIHPGDRKRAGAAFKATLQYGVGFDEVYRVQFPYGEQRYYHSSLKVKQNNQGHPVSISGTTRDVTERKELEVAIVRATEEERQRISLELHDGLGQKLTGVSFRAGQLMDVLRAKGILEEDAARELTQLIKESAETLRDIARGVQPVPAYPDGLEMSLKRMVAETVHPPGVKCHFACPEPVPLQDPSTANNLFRIAQEALNNALRHGNPRRVVVRLAKNADEICLEVQDDGKGIPADEQVQKGLGLRAMRFRAQAIRGSIVIQPIIPKGTLVRVAVPDALLCKM